MGDAMGRGGMRPLHPGFGLGSRRSRRSLMKIPNGNSGAEAAGET